MWIARDKDGMICVYAVEPTRYETAFGVEDDNWISLYPREFLEITWENSPVELISLKGIMSTNIEIES